MSHAHEELGGSAEAWEKLLRSVAAAWGMWVPDIVSIFEKKATWQPQCEERGVNAEGLTRSESHLPRYLRNSKHCKGVVVRKSGADRKDTLRFVYPIVEQFYETMGLYGKQVDVVDLEDYLQLIMQRYIDEAQKPDVVEAIEHTTALGKRFEVVKEELLGLKDSKMSAKVHEDRQQALTKLCGGPLEDTPNA